MAGVFSWASRGVSSGASWLGRQFSAGIGGALDFATDLTDFARDIHEATGAIAGQAGREALSGGGEVVEAGARARGAALNPLTVIAIAAVLLIALGVIKLR